MVAVTGENLDKDNVAKVYLTDGKNDLACEITGQTATEIKFKIPAKAAGRMALMILTGGKGAEADRAAGQSDDRVTLTYAGRAWTGTSSIPAPRPPAVRRRWLF